MTDDRAVAFGALLLRLRGAAGLGQEQLAHAAGVSVRAIRDMERGRVRGPQRRTAEALAAALGLEAAERESFLRAAAAGRAARPAPVRKDQGGDEERSTGGVLWGLPPATLDLAGRDGELAALRAWSAEAVDQARPGPLVAAISGQPGVGKTSLAVEAARTLADVFPDGAVFVGLRGTDERPASPYEALERVLRALGMSASRLPATLEERSARLGALLRGRRVLLVLDNAADERQVRPLLPALPGSAALVTSRRMLVGLDGTRFLSLDVLPPDGCLALLRRGAGAERVDAEPEAARRIAELCGHLPLALRIVGNRLAVRPGWSLAHVAGKLADEERRLEMLAAGDLAVRAAFLVSYQQLGPESRRVFRRLSLLSGAEFGAPLAAVPARIGTQEAEAVLEELADSSLLQPGGEAGRYRLHDLLRLFARERLLAEEPRADVAAVEDLLTGRLLEWATSAAAALDVVLPRGGRDAGGGEAARGARTVPWPGSPESAFEWLEREREHWLAAVRTAAARGRHEETVRLAHAMHWYSDRSSRTLPWVELFGYGLDAARALGSADDEALFLNFVGWALDEVHAAAPEAILAVHHEALELARAIGNELEEAWALTYIAVLLIGLGRLDEAVEHAETSWKLFRRLDHPMGDKSSRSALGLALSAAGRHEEALATYRELHTDYGRARGRLSDELIPAGQALMGFRIGRSLAALGRWREAVQAQVDARRELARVQGYRWIEANAALEEGLARRRLGDGAARDCFLDAVRTFDELGDPEGAAAARAALAQEDGERGASGTG